MRHRGVRAVAVAAVTAAAMSGFVAGAAVASADAATITSLTPSYGPVGTVVHVVGTGLTGATAASVGGVAAAAPTVVDDAHLNLTVPAGAHTGAVVVSTPGGNTSGPAFTVSTPVTTTVAATPRTLTYPTATTVTVAVASAGSAVAGQPVSLQARRAGTTAFTTVATAATGTTGRASWAVKPATTVDYRAVVAASPAHLAATTSLVRVWVRPRVTLAVPAVVPQLTAVTVSGTVSPGSGGMVTVQVDRGSGWAVWGTATVSSTGHFARTLTFSTLGPATFRAVRPADATHVTGISATVGRTVVRRTLRPGTSGADVLALQQRLAALHYDVGSRSGYYGYDTQHAVTAFEKVQRITRDGVTGPTVWSRLSTPVVPHLLHPTTTGSTIEVDLTRQVVFLSSAGHLVRIIDASTGGGYWFTGSGGTWEQAITPTGAFRILYKVNHWVTAPLGTLYRPAYFTNTGVAIHGEGSVPSYPASHGCVRITVPAMDRLYALLPTGMRVWVYRS